MPHYDKAIIIPLTLDLVPQYVIPSNCHGRVDKLGARVMHQSMGALRYYTETEFAARFPRERGSDKALV